MSISSRTGVFLPGQKCCLRSWEPEDAEQLATLANNKKIWSNLLDEFPHPYHLDHANMWISICQDGPARFANLAICRYDELDPNKTLPIGGIGISPSGQSMCKKRVKLVGYWIGEPFWGKGITSEALNLLTNYAFTDICAEKINDSVPIVRLEAAIFAHNSASGRVLQKNGYTLESIQRAAYYKEEKYVDAHLYVKLNPDIITTTTL